MKRRNVFVGHGLAFLCLGAVVQTNAEFSPIPLNPSSFTYDLIVEKDAIQPFTPASNASVDGGTNNTGNTWYEMGYNVDFAHTGLPVAGSTVPSAIAPDNTYKFAPSFSANNALLLDNQVKNGVLTLTTPAAYSALSFLSASGNGATVVAYTLNFADGTTETGTFTVLDWFNAAEATVTAAGRVNPVTGAFADVDSANPKMFAIDVPVTKQGVAINSIALSFSSGGASAHAGIFALSGSTGGAFSPIDITGYNVDMIVEATAARPHALEATTGTVDGGPLNTGNSWYEVGYNRNAPTTGFPAAGSTITNVSATDHSYKLASSYAAPNGILISSVDPTGELTFATPATFSALSVLGASGNGAITIDYTINHSDGTTQPGSFVVPDWFNQTPFAYVARGRVNVQNGSFNNVNAENPRLYAVDIAVANTAVPITSVSLVHNAGTGRATIYAISGAAGAVKPIFDAQPASANVMEGGAIDITATVSGTAPITYQWQRDVNGTFTNVQNANGVSGATTATISFANATISMSGAYRLVARNAAGETISVVTRLNVLSTKADVTAFTDEITAFGGTTPANEPVANAIDDTTTKYLNFGDGNDGNTGAPFTGPVGLVVTPAMGPTVVTALRVYTANDGVERDPTTYTLEGSVDGTSFTQIAAGTLSLPDARNGAGQILDPLTLANQEVNFANTIAYTTYRLTFTNVKNNTTANSMQIGEIELLGEAGTIQPRLNISVNADLSVTLTWAGEGRVQSTTSLVNPTWTDVAGSSGVSLPSTGTQRFFRLVQ